MKKTRKILCVLGILFAAGILFTIVGAVSGAKLYNARLPFSHFEEEIKKIDKSFAEDTTIENLDFSLNAAYVTINYGDTFSVRGSGIKKNTISNGTWKIITQDNNRFFSFLHRKITITIPKDKTFNNINLSVNAAKSEIDSLSCNSCILNISCGQLSMKSLNANTIEANASMGSIKIENYNFSSNAELSCSMGNIDLGNASTYSDNVSNNTSFDASMGDIRFYGKASGKNTIDCSMADVKLWLIGDDSNYDFNGDGKSADNIIGSFDTDCNMGNYKVNYMD